MATPAPHLYKDFDRHYHNIKKFGEKIANELATNFAQSPNVTAHQVQDYMAQKQVVSQFDAEINKAVEATYSSLNPQQLHDLANQIKLQHQPRADITQDPEVRFEKQNTKSTRARQQTKTHPWFSEADLAAEIADAINNRPSNTSPNQALVTQFKDKLNQSETGARNEYQRRLRMRMAPSPSPSPSTRPKPPQGGY
jgi:hypothetical protein